ncbi:12275_t:CDS:2, partial [Funneliformis mosseae]
QIIFDHQSIDIMFQIVRKGVEAAIKAEQAANLKRHKIHGDRIKIPSQRQCYTDAQWKYLLEHKIIRQFSDQYRRTHGSLPVKIKKVVYHVFAEHNLPTIKSIGGWAKWKESTITEWAFENLDNPIDSQDLSECTMAVISLFLDPHSGTVEMNEGVVTPKMIIYLNELDEIIEDFN